jgi:hypothetical protein
VPEPQLRKTLSFLIRLFIREDLEASCPTCSSW